MQFLTTFVSMRKIILFHCVHQAAICADVALSTKNKTEAEVKRYYKLFWERYKELVCTELES